VLAHELIYGHQQGLRWIVDTTPRVLGQDWQKLAAVAQELGDKVAIVTGCTGTNDLTVKHLFEEPETLDSAEFELEVKKAANDFEFDIKTGYNNIKAGFIGEIIILQMSDIEKARLTAAVTVSKDIGVPIIVSLDDNESMISQFVEYVQKDLDYDNPKLIVQTSVIKPILDTNFTLCLTQFSRGLTDLKNNHSKNYKMKDNRHEIHKFLKSLDPSDTIISRILISTNVTGTLHLTPLVKTHLLQFGGDSYSIYNFLSTHSDPIPTSTLSQIFIINPIPLFRYFTR